jgi:hypothetical protein
MWFVLRSIHTYIHASAFQSIHKCAISTEYKTCQKQQITGQSQTRSQGHQFNYS